MLAQRVSVATVQGYEWIAGGVFAQRTAIHDQANGCAYVDSACLLQWRKSTGVGYDYVLFSKPPYGQCCDRLIQSMRSDPMFRLVYDGGGATIYQYMG